MKKRVNTVRFKGFVSNRTEASSVLSHAGDLVIVRREGLPRWIVLRCPSGCGDDVVLNLDRRTGRAWSLYQERGARISIYPSVWRDSGCGSHFIVWRNRVSWCEYDEDTLGSDESIDSEKLRSVLEILSDKPDYVSYEEMATRLNSVPWEVLTLCRRLSRDGRIEEGYNKDRGKFRLVKR